MSFEIGPETRSSVILTFILLYMGLCIAIGLWAMRRTSSSRDFFMAGRDLGIFVTALAVFSSTLSGFGFVGGPGLVYRMGISSLWMVVCATVGYCIAFFLLGKRLRLFGEVRDSVSLPDAVAARYGSETSRLLTAVAILLGVVGYLGTQILAMAIVLQEVLASSSETFALGLPACVALSCSVLVFYCVTGGIIAGVYTDLFQGSVMIVAAIFVFFAAQDAVDGGFAGVSRTLLADDPEAIGPWGTLGIFGSLSWYFLFAIGLVGQPHVVTKLMMNKRPRDSRFILPLSIVSYSVSALLWISIGLVMRALVLQGVHPELSTADAAAPQFLEAYTHPVLAGVVFAGLFAAIMSTADGFLNIGAAAVVHDIPRALGRAVRSNSLGWARIATAVIGVVAALFALYSHYFNERLVALLGVFGWATFAAALVPAVAIGFNWKRATPLAANTAIVTSLAVNLGVELSGVRIPFGVHGGTLALVVSLLLFFGISFASRPPRLPADIRALLDL